MLNHDTHLDEPDEPFYPEIMLRPVPFPLSPEFLHQLGYDRADEYRPRRLRRRQVTGAHGSS